MDLARKCEILVPRSVTISLFDSLSKKDHQIISTSGFEAQVILKGL